MKSVSQWFQFIRDVCSWYLTKHLNVLDGEIVEIDESNFKKIGRSGVGTSHGITNK